MVVVPRAAYDSEHIQLGKSDMTYGIIIRFEPHLSEAKNHENDVECHSISLSLRSFRCDGILTLQRSK